MVLTGINAPFGLGAQSALIHDPFGVQTTFDVRQQMVDGRDPPTGLGYWEATEQKSSIRKMSSNFLDDVELRKVASPHETKKSYVKERERVGEV